MTIVTTISICLAVVCAFLLGRSIIISIQRDNRIKRLKGMVTQLDDRLNFIANCSKHKCYEIEEDELTDAYNVNMKVHVYRFDDSFDTICYCLIKAFPFADDKEPALRDAQELLDKLNEK